MQLDWLSVAVLLFLIGGAGFAAFSFIPPLILSYKSRGGDLKLPYECGIVPHGHPRVRFGINYYFYALLFLAFDVDVLYLFPVAASYLQSEGWLVFWELLVFVGILGLAVVYFWRKGVFNWPRKINF